MHTQKQTNTHIIYKYITNKREHKDKHKIYSDIAYKDKHKKYTNIHIYNKYTHTYLHAHTKANKPKNTQYIHR